MKLKLVNLVPLKENMRARELADSYKLSQLEKKRDAIQLELDRDAGIIMQQNGKDDDGNDIPGYDPMNDPEIIDLTNQNADELHLIDAAIALKPK